MPEMKAPTWQDFPGKLAGLPGRLVYTLTRFRVRVLINVSG
jgi:hypothetical protein